MYKIFLLIISLIAVTTVSAQTREEAFKKLEAICNEAKGMTFYRDMILGDQHIRENEVTVIMSNNETVEKDTYTSFRWQDISKYSLTPLKANAKICTVAIIFSGEIEHRGSTMKGNVGDEFFTRTGFMQLYIPAGKEDEAKKYLDIIKAP